MYISLFAQIIIHEAGHLIFGLLTGYKFNSFRIFSFMFIKEEEKIKLKKLSLTGTAGQCLMSPPDIKNGKAPVILYNLGGVITNIIAGFIFFGLYFILESIPLLANAMIISAVFGFISAITNGFPLKTLSINNDGQNTLELLHNENAKSAFFTQMKVAEKTAENIRLKDMPEEWFTLQSDEAIKNSLVATINVFACSRLVDAHKFEEADRLMQHLLESENGVVGLHKKLMICDRIYIELISANRADVLNRLLSKEQQKFMKQMKNFPTVIRTEYLYALLAEQDTKKAEQLKAKFEKCARNYPYQSDIQS
ncbi:MAG: hypothetical protein K2F65_03970 [Eubacterium sp.]|nr:hypothetical protein [Eubacterium sp.]